IERQIPSGNGAMSDAPGRKTTSGAWVGGKPVVSAELGRNQRGVSASHAPEVVFRPGASDIAPLPLGIWRSIWKEVASHLPPAHCGQRGGDLELRIAIADYLGRSRGVACESGDVIITASATQAIDLIARAILIPGDRVGFEEPGYMLARQMLLARGSSIVPIPVDDDGLQVDTLPTGSSAPLLAYVTPSHQFPLGGRLPIARRIALLKWAEAHDSLIIEDDYDHEFRFDASPLPALASLDKHGRVVYLGTFSKILSPALRLGYLIAPSPLRQRLEQAALLPTDYAAWPIQRVLLACMKEGHLDRHIRRMRRLYAEKRTLLSNLLAPVSHLAQIHGLEAGLHVYLELHSELESTWIVQEAYKRGVIVAPLSPFYLEKPDRNGLLLGYGGLTLSEISQGATILAEVIASIASKVGL
ncbi:MAG TPA: PLP-dependent aminotransferase family protein, partial [Ktedonobacteraceae bacterium]|nr:PLP-dependent aminotransferase family protein [Ktedonobacteraceae bacterium]